LHDSNAVCELGAGQMGLAGFFLAAELTPNGPKVTITDGNLNCSESLKKNLELNLERYPHFSDKVQVK